MDIYICVITVKWGMDGLNQMVRGGGGRWGRVSKHMVFHEVNRKGAGGGAGKG